MGRRKKPQLKLSQNSSLFDTDSLECRPSQVFGRHLITKRNVKKGEVLIKEPWIVAGPSIGTDQPVCVGCHGNVKTSKRCNGCDWYVCTALCSTASPFHTVTECTFFKDRGIKVLENFDFGALTVLRSLMLKLHSSETWEILMTLGNHNDQQKSLGTWKKFKAIVDLIRKKWNLCEIFTANEIFQVCGILEVNSYEMGDGFSFQGIFFKSSMIAHACVPNCTQNENIDDNCLEISAILDIPAGQPIFLCYSSLLEGTCWRQIELQRSKYFRCTCARCVDVTELGTNFSTLQCQRCKSGLVVQIDEMTWGCSKCQNRITTEDVDVTCVEYRNLRNNLKTVGDREEFLKNCSSIFHPNHFIPFKVKFDLCLAYGHDEGFTLEILTSGQVSRKVELCQSVLKVLDAISAGHSVARGNVLYELQAAQVLMVRRGLNNEKCSRRLLRSRMKSAMENLLEAISIFELHYSLKLLARNAKEITLMELKASLQEI